MIKNSNIIWLSYELGKELNTHFKRYEGMFFSAFFPVQLEGKKKNQGKERKCIKSPEFSVNENNQLNSLHFSSLYGVS